MHLWSSFEAVFFANLGDKAQLDFFLAAEHNKEQRTSSCSFSRSSRPFELHCGRQLGSSRLARMMHEVDRGRRGSIAISFLASLRM